jgi:hypothetical protein
MAHDARLIIQLPRGGAVERGLAPERPPSVAGGDVVVDARPADARGRLAPLALGVEVRVGHRVPPWTRRRARLASWRAASGERSTIGAISPNGTVNMSCSTNASRSGGDSVSSTASSAAPTESPSSAWCSGSVPSARSIIGSGTRTSSGSSRRTSR